MQHTNAARQAANDKLAATARMVAVNKAEIRREEHIDAKRRQQAAHQENAKFRMQDSLYQAELAKTQRRTLLAEDDALASAMQDLEHKRLSDLAYAKRVCEESPEILELKQHLQAAKINKIRETQLRERDLVQRQEARREKLLEDAMERDRLAAAEQDSQDVARRTFMHVQGRKVLEQQIDDKRLRQEEAVQQHLKERAQVDEIVARIQREDRALAERKVQQTKEFYNSVRAFLVERESSRLAEFQRAQEELRKNEEYQQLQEARLREAEARKGDRTREHDNFVSRLVAELEAKKREQDQIRQLLDELYQDELEARAQAADQEAIRKRHQRKEEMITVNEQLLAFKAEKQQQLLREEVAFRQSMMDKFLADARMEQMNADRRRREIAAYRQEIEQLIADRRAQFEAQIERDVREMQLQAEREAGRERFIAEERARLLRENAEFKDYMPRGAVRDQSEYEVLHGVKPNPELIATQKHFKVANPLFKNREQWDS